MRSLAECLQAAEAAVAAPVLGQDTHTLERIYDHVYMQCFGCQSRRRSTHRNDLIFSRLLAYLLEEDVDPALWITANMQGLQRRLVGKRYGFQPNMLMGEKAKGRYNAYVRRTNRRTRRAAVESLAAQTELGRLRTVLVADETAVGEYFIAAGLSGGAVTWEASAAQFDVSPEWLALQAERGAGFALLARKLGHDSVSSEKRLVTLRAAFAVVSAYASALPAQIGIRTFTWQGLLTVLQEVVVTTPVPFVLQRADLGQHWSGRGVA